MDIEQARERLSTAGLYIHVARSEWIIGNLPPDQDDNQGWRWLSSIFDIIFQVEQWHVFLRYAQIGVRIKSSNDLAQAVTALIDYFELMQQLKLPHRLVRHLLTLYTFNGLFIDINSSEEIALTVRGNPVGIKPDRWVPDNAPITDQWNLVMNTDETWSAQHTTDSYEHRCQCFIDAADHILKAYGINRLRQFAFSPDQHRIALAWGDEQDYIEVFERQDEDMHLEIKVDKAHFTEFYWSPNSQQLAVLTYSAGEGDAEQWMLKTYRVEYQLEFRRPARQSRGYHRENYHSYMFGESDSSLIEVIHWEPIAADNGAHLPVLVKWHPESELIAVAFPHRLTIFDPFQDVEVVSFETQGIQHLEWTPDGQAIITHSDQHGTQRWLGPAG